MRVIDFHLHLCRTAVEESKVFPQPGKPTAWYWANAERIFDYLDFWMVDRIVALNVMNTRRMIASRLARAGTSESALASITGEVQDKVRSFNDWICDLSGSDDRIVPFVFADPVLFGERLGDELRRWVSKGAVGVKVHPKLGGYLPTDQQMEGAYQVCIESSIPILTDTSSAAEGGVQFGAPRGWSPVLDRFPGLKVIFAHLGGDMSEELVTLADSYENCWFDISGGFVDPRHPPATHRAVAAERAAELIRRVGMSRVLFGSDAPGENVDIADAVLQVRALGLTDGESERILFANAAELLDRSR